MPASKKPLATAATLLLALASAAGVTLWWRSAEAPEAAAGAPAQAAAGTPQAIRAASQGAPSATPIASAPLPSIAAPLALVVDGLKARSDAGDPGAACRLAAELAYCEHRDVARAEYDQWLADRQRALDMLPDAADKQRMAAKISQRMEMREGMIDRMSRHCEGVQVGSANDIAAQWRRAALLGSPAAMKHYASGNAFRWSSLLDSLPMLATYRSEAESFALRVARDGDAEMLMALAVGYDPTASQRQNLLSQALHPNAARSLALYQRVQAVVEAMPENERGRLSGLQRQLASRRSALENILSAQDKAEARRVLEQELSAWSPPAFNTQRPFSSDGGQPFMDRFACGAPPGETRRRRAPPG